MIRAFVSRDMASVALGADAIADALAAAGCTVVRTGSRGLFAIEPLVEVETAEGRIAYGPVEPGDVAEDPRRQRSEPARPHRGSALLRRAAAIHLRALRGYRSAEPRRLSGA